MSKILVVGATGNQGGAVTAAALAMGYSVVAFTRDPGGDREAALVNRGVDLAAGSLDDTDSITSAANGVDAMFAMTTPYAGLDTEIRHGSNIAEAAAAADVPHLVFSSVADADNDTRIGHFASKWAIEENIREIGLPATVVAPVFFMDNFLFPTNTSDIADGRLRQAIRADQPLQMVTARDIGRIATMVIGDPDRFIGERISIAGDELTGPEMAGILSKATGRPVEYQVQPDEELDAMGPDWRRMYEWFNEGGFTTDRRALASQFPAFRFQSFEDWAGAQPWNTILTPAHDAETAQHQRD
jgi:uncharacterized protein YbjT (DUF2867 family)